MWRGCRVVFGWLGRFPPVRALRRQLGRLPPLVALPLFLVPEAASEGGFLVSAWLVWQHRPLAATVFYVSTKLLATLLAVWIYQCCEPSLLRVRWFARAHHVMAEWRQALFAWGRARLDAARMRLFPPGAHGARLAHRYRVIRRQFAMAGAPSRQDGPA